jgi:hypothetical protein
MPMDHDGQRGWRSAGGFSKRPIIAPTPPAEAPTTTRSRRIDPASTMGNAPGRRRSLDPRSDPLRVLRVESARGSASDTGRVGAAAGLVVRMELVKSLALLAAVGAPRLHLTPALTVSALHGAPPLGKTQTAARPAGGLLTLQCQCQRQVLGRVVETRRERSAARPDNAGPRKSPAHHGAGTSPACSRPRPGLQP